MKNFEVTLHSTESANNLSNIKKITHSGYIQVGAKGGSLEVNILIGTEDPTNYFKYPTTIQDGEVLGLDIIIPSGSTLKFISPDSPTDVVAHVLTYPGK